MSEESTESASTPRAAAEAYLRGRKVEAAAVFKRPPVGRGGESEFTTDDIRRVLEWIYERLRMGRIGRLQGSFLIAVTADEVFAFKFMERFGTFEVRDEIAVFDRNEIRIRSMAGGQVLSLEVTEEGRRRSIELDGEVVSVYPGAADVIAALKPLEAAELSE